MNPIAFNILGFGVRWYSIFVLIAVALCIFFVEQESKRFNIRQDFIFNMSFWTFIVGVFGARLYYVIFNYSFFKKNILDIFKIWEGGLAIHGGILFGLIFIICYCKKYKVRTIRIIDIVAPALLIAQTVGRWGNFFNQEAYGAATSAETLRRLLIPEFIINGMTIDNVVYTPTFLYESILCLIAFVVILILRRGKYVKVSQPTAFYLIAYGIIRFFIEISRTDSLMLGGFKIAQIVSIIFFIVGISIIAYTSKKSKFEDLYNDKENIENIRF